MSLERIRPFLWPALVVVGLAIVGCAQASWGASDQGAQLQVSGLGGVSARAAATADVEAAFSAHTERPALLTLVFGIVIALAALLGWWKPFRRNTIGVLAVSAVIVAAGVATIVVAAMVIADPAGRLFDAAVNDAIDAPGPLLSPAWGVIATLILAVLSVVLAPLTSIRRGLIRETAPG